MRVRTNRMLIILISLLPACFENTSEKVAGQTFIYEPEIVEYYHNQVIEFADSLLLLPALSLTQDTGHTFAVKPGTYISMACYWWPDPSSVNGLPYIRIDGMVNPETRTHASHLPSLIEMAQRVHITAAAYNLTGREEFAEHAVEQLYVWFIDQESAMLPHLEHAQMVKGLNTGRSYGIIDGWWLVRIIESLDHLVESRHWNPELEIGLKAWFTDFLFWLLNSEFGSAEMKSKNNHGTWFDVQVVTYAIFTGYEDLAKLHLQNVSNIRLRRQFSPSGRQKFEMRRTRPLHYGIYNLSGQLKLAEYAKTLGFDYGHNRTFFSSGLEAGVLYLIQGLNGADTTTISDPHDQTDIDVLYLGILSSAYNLYQNEVIKNEKIRYQSNQNFINLPILPQQTF